MALFINRIKGWPTDKVSGRVLLVLLVLTAVVFALFWLVGYNLPYLDDASFNAPLFTDLLLFFTYLLLVGAVAVAVVSAVRSLRRREVGDGTVNGVPARRIAWGVVGLLVVSLVLTFALGSGEPMKINGVDFAETFWLKATDMFVNTIIVLMVVALAAVLYGVSGINRRRK